MFEPREIADDILLRTVQTTDALAIATALAQNRAYLAPWEPVRPEAYFTESWWTTELLRATRALGQEAELPLVLEDLRGGSGSRVDADPGTIARNTSVVGRFTLGSISRGPFQSAGLGYWVVESHAGRGLASATVQAIVADARDRLGLHRIEAGTLPDNAGSQRVLAKAGFERIGYAPRYLSINGTWQDHVLFQRILEH
ncbi:MULTISPECIES: GNAT family N-acetyltransferase [unclassified Plantibacter]|jgi:ribosomal-protein-alanine N-acetyltransferase|uniref:GNAT family N-acetyltransferase n=1 Tax=unclassified Plantibacter TaxID=2624265 RepID=UPI003D358DDB